MSRKDWTPTLWILNAAHEAVPIVDRELWVEWLSTDDHDIVFEDDIGDVRVVTVFQGLDLRATPTGPPLLFRTEMYFDGELQDGLVQAATWDQALEAHRIVLADARAIIAEEEAHLVKTFAGARMEAIAAWKARKRGSERS